jgi:hypothetical protein
MTRQLEYPLEKLEKATEYSLGYATARHHLGILADTFMAAHRLMEGDRLSLSLSYWRASVLEERGPDDVQNVVDRVGERVNMSQAYTNSFTSMWFVAAFWLACHPALDYVGRDGRESWGRDLYGQIRNATDGRALPWDDECQLYTGLRKAATDDTRHRVAALFDALHALEEVDVVTPE